MAKPIHSMIRVLTRPARSTSTARPSASKAADRFDFDGFTLVYLHGQNAFEVELTVNQGRTEPYALGDAYGHIAFVVDDLAAEHARFEGGTGAQPMRNSTRGALMAKFFFVQDPDGYRIEVLQRHGRYR